MVQEEPSDQVTSGQTVEMKEWAVLIWGEVASKYNSKCADPETQLLYH